MQFIFLFTERKIPNVIQVVLIEKWFNISDNAVHLGHTISPSDRERISLTAKSNFWKSFNSFISNFGHTYSFIKCSLFKQFCCSLMVHHYGI